MFDLLSSLLGRLAAPRMVYGYRAADGRWLAHTRISTHAHIEQPEHLVIGDHVFIGHFNFIDASGGLEIGEGCQISNHVSILTHSSHRAVRLCGRAYFGHPRPPGYLQASTAIGPYGFIGPHAVIAPGSRLGRGVVVKAYSYVDGHVPDFAVVQGQPARVVHDVREADRALLLQHPEMRAHYAAWAGEDPLR